jgi:L-ascorbate metabolism protein UlaG (beta-lactamase superfamily)
MIIQWLGQSCFKISTKNTQGEFTIINDPYQDSVGLKMSKLQADIVTVSTNQDGHNNVDAIKGDPFIITNPGEYEIKGVFIYGVPALMVKEKNKLTIFKVICEDISIAHLSDLSQPLDNEQIEKLGNVDILLIPVGGKNSLDGKKAGEVISQLDPRLVIPMNYKVDGQKTDLNTADDFLKSCGLKSETLDKLKVAKKDLMTEDTRVIVLTA